MEHPLWVRPCPGGPFPWPTRLKEGCLLWLEQREKVESIVKRERCSRNQISNINCCSSADISGSPSSTCRQQECFCDFCPSTPVFLSKCGEGRDSSHMQHKSKMWLEPRQPERWRAAESSLGTLYLPTSCYLDGHYSREQGRVVTLQPLLRFALQTSK